MIYKKLIFCIVQVWCLYFSLSRKYWTKEMYSRPHPLCTCLLRDIFCMVAKFHFDYFYNEKMKRRCFGGNMRTSVSGFLCMNPGDPSSRCSMQLAVRHTTAINTPLICEACTACKPLALTCMLWCNIDAGWTAPRGNLHNVVMHALRCFSRPHESLVGKSTIFPDTSRTMWHQARGLLSSSPPVPALVHR